MTADGALQTWDVLRDFGFQPDSAVVSDIRPGLSFDFGGFHLAASATVSRWFDEIVLLTGVLVTARSGAEVVFEMPREAESREMVAAWLAWNLDRAARGRFESRVPVPWLEVGRAHVSLLPWHSKPKSPAPQAQCRVDRESVRSLLKKLREEVGQMNEAELVWFSFDGEVLKIRWGNQVLACAGTGTVWSERFGISPSELKNLPNRLMGHMVSFSVWRESFTIANRRFRGVVTETSGDK